MTAGEILLDVRDLEPPEPFELATSELRSLKPGQYVRMVCPRRPRMLYPWLAEFGFCEATCRRDEDLYDIYIWIGDDSETTSLLAGKTS
jgi:hypothetical protein